MSSFGTGIMADIPIERAIERAILSRAAVTDLTSIKPTDISFGPLACREICYPV